MFPRHQPNIIVEQETAETGIISRTQRTGGQAESVEGTDRRCFGPEPVFRLIQD